MSDIARVKEHYEKEQVLAGYLGRYQGLKGEYFQRLESDLVLQLADFQDKRVLDIGSGTGRMGFLLALQAKEVVGVEVSAPMVAWAKKEAKRQGFDNLRFIKDDFLRVDLPPGYFDVALSIGTFEYVADLSPFLKKIYHLLKPGGQLIFTAHNSSFSKAVVKQGPYPIARWSLGGLGRVLRENKFNLKKAQGTFYVAPWLVWRVFRFLPGEFLKKIWLRAIISWNQRSIACLADDVDKQSQKARQWIILAQKQ